MHQSRICVSGSRRKPRHGRGVRQWAVRPISRARWRGSGWHRSQGRALRRLAFPLWLAARAARRARRRGSCSSSLGLAAAAAMLAAVLAGTTAAEDREVAGAGQPSCRPKVRAVRVNWFSVGGQVAPYATLDASVRRQLERGAAERATGTSLYRESTSSAVRCSASARWTTSAAGCACARAACRGCCRPEHCEVLVDPARRADPERARPAARRRSARATCARRRSSATRSRRRTCGESAFVAEDPPLPPAGAAAARARQRRRRARPLAASCTTPTAATAGWCRCGAARCAPGRPRALATRIEQARTALPGIELRLRADARPPTSCAPRPTRPRRRSAAAAARRRGGRAAARVRGAGGGEAAAGRGGDARAAAGRAASRRWQSGLVVFVESVGAALAGTVLGWLRRRRRPRRRSQGGAASRSARCSRHSLLSGRGLVIALRWSRWPLRSCS